MCQMAHCHCDSLSLLLKSDRERHTEITGLKLQQEGSEIKTQAVAIHGTLCHSDRIVTGLMAYVTHRRVPYMTLNVALL